MSFICRNFTTNSECRTRQFITQCPQVLAMTVGISGLGMMLIVSNEPRSSFQLYAARPSVVPPLLWQRLGIRDCWLSCTREPNLAHHEPQGMAWHSETLESKTSMPATREPSNIIDCVNEHVAVTLASGVETSSPKWGLLSAELKQYHLPAKVPGALSCLLGLLQ